MRIAWPGLTLSALLLATACGTEVDALPDGGGDDDDPDAAIAGGPDAARADAPVAPGPDAASMPVDDDGDGLDDAWEAQIAATYLPFLSLHPSDGCPLGGAVYRLRPHPANAALIHVIYDHLYQNDCGLGGHVGDNEVFAITVDPTIPPPMGIRAMKAISHQGTLCERISECGNCPGMTACETGLKDGAAWPAVYASKDKHGTYVLGGACGFGACFDTCTLAATSQELLLVNVGEPDGHLVANLTTEGFITAANGWTEAAVMNVDPWGPADFGGAGNIAGDLVDPAFDTQTCL